MNGSRQFLSFTAVLLSVWVLLFSPAQAVTSDALNKSKTQTAAIDDCE